MAYVLEYSAFRYERRRRRRNVFFAFLGVVVLFSALYALWWDSVTKSPTFADYVSNGVKDAKDAGPSLQSQADQIWARHEAYSALRAEYDKFQDYLPLFWVPVPATNLLSTVARELSGNRELGLLEPTSFRIEFLERAPKADSGARPRSLELHTEWRTRREYSVEEGNMTRTALSNFLARSFSGRSGPEVSSGSFSFPNGGKADEKVVADFLFPGAPVLLSCPELDQTVLHLDALCKAMRTAAIGRDGSQEVTISQLKDLLDTKGSIAFKKRAKEFERSLAPGEWFKAFTVNCTSNINVDTAGVNLKKGRSILAAWDRAFSGRSPRDRRILRKVLSSRDFMTGADLQAFLSSSVPDAKTMDDCRTNHFLNLVSGITNAIAAELFVPFDPAPYGRDVFHGTTNLFALPGKLDVVPSVRRLADGGTTNLSSFGAVGDLSSGESFIVGYPTVQNEGGVRLSLPGGGESSARYLFCKWSWSYSSTNRPADLVRFSDGLRDFLSYGFGYEPRRIEASLRGGKAVSLSVEGRVPVKLDTEGDSRAAKKPESGAGPGTER